MLKPGPLDPAEWEIMRRHCLYGCEILGPLNGTDTAQNACGFLLGPLESGDNELLRLARILALYHHERWDGTGYPIGLAGEAIPLEARIVSVVDVYDALRSDRPYKKAFPVEKCFALLQKGAGSQFDPAIIEAFFREVDAIRAIRQKWKD
nr:HD domain-containing phosphohydrolase [Desulfolutivibrio sulfodismutans]